MAAQPSGAPAPWRPSARRAGSDGCRSRWWSARCGPSRAGSRAHSRRFRAGGWPRSGAANEWWPACCTPAACTALAEGFLQTAFLHRARLACCSPGGDSAGKQPDRVAMGAPVGAQEGQGAWRQGDGAILVAFATANVQLHARAVDLRDLEAHAFEQAQATGVDHTQADAVMLGVGPARRSARPPQELSTTGSFLGMGGRSRSRSGQGRWRV